MKLFGPTIVEHIDELMIEGLREFVEIRGDIIIGRAIHRLLLQGREKIGLNGIARLLGLQRFAEADGGLRIAVTAQNMKAVAGQLVEVFGRAARGLLIGCDCVFKGAAEHDFEKACLSEFLPKRSIGLAPHRFGEGLRRIRKIAEIEQGLRQTCVDGRAFGTGCDRILQAARGSA